MKVILPLAGLGTRLRPHTYTRPKALLNVGGKPMLSHVLDRLKGLEAEETIFIVGHLGEQIEDWVRTHYPVPARFLVQEEMLGQSDAIALARPFVDGPVLILFADTIFETDFKEMRETSLDGLIYVKEVEDPSRFGVVLVEKGLITRLVEKPSTPISNLAVIGLYYLADSGLMFECIEEQMASGRKELGEYFLAEALQMMVDRGARLGTVPVEVWEDCGKPETLLATNRYLLEKAGPQRVKAEDSVIIQPVAIAESATVRNSVIGPYVSVAEKGVILSSVIRDSIIDEGARIERAILSQSLIGPKAEVRGDYAHLDVGDSCRVNLS